MVERYRVDGMTCQGCARSVTGAIAKLAPTASVTVDLPAKIVAVEGEAGADLVRKAVEAAGFEFLGAA